MTETSSLNQYNKANDIIKIRKGKGLLLTYVIMSIKAENSRIAKNTISLYIRTVIVLFVSLYTSRLVLQALGETDLGIYNLVGGIVSLMAFLQAAQTKSTSRFITYELGLGGEPSKLSRIYSICMTIHILLAIIIVIIAETLGLFIINEYTQIPTSRMVAANLVYQFSILTFVMHFIRCPLDSVIIAHEDMTVYAYMSILEVSLQLGLVFAVLHYSGDNLILYGFLVFAVSVVLFICYLIYRRKTYPAYRYRFIWDKKESVRVLSFSGWTLLGSSANTFTQQGVALLFNNFVGLVANTALGFANQVNAAVGRFVSSFTTAFNPQIIKLQAQDDRNSLFILMNRASRFSFALCYVMALPIITNMEFILSLWLGRVPEYTTEFCQLILVCSIIDATTGVFNTSITATGEIKNYQIGIALSFLLDLTCASIFLYLGIHPAVVFGSRIITRGFMNMLIGFHYSKKLLAFPLRKYLFEVMIPIGITILITIPISMIRMAEGWLSFILNTILTVVAVSLCTLYIIMKKHERTTIIKAIKNRFYAS